MQHAASKAVGPLCNQLFIILSHRLRPTALDPAEHLQAKPINSMQHMHLPLRKQFCPAFASGRGTKGPPTGRLQHQSIADWPRCKLKPPRQQSLRPECSRQAARMDFSEAYRAPQMYSKGPIPSQAESIVRGSPQIQLQEPDKPPSDIDYLAVSVQCAVCMQYAVQAAKHMCDPTCNCALTGSSGCICPMQSATAVLRPACSHQILGRRLTTCLQNKSSTVG